MITLVKYHVLMMIIPFKRYSVSVDQVFGKVPLYPLDCVVLCLLLNPLKQRYSVRPVHLAQFQLII